VFEAKSRIKYFQFSTYGTKEEALAAAVSYRNSELERHLKELELELSKQ
jgi:hypothetical protein